MTKNAAAVAAKVDRTVSSSKVASGMKQQKRKPHVQVHNEGFDDGVRSCVEAMLEQGESRDYIAWTLLCQDISFPFTNDPRQGEWAYDDWFVWAAAEQS